MWKPKSVKQRNAENVAHGLGMLDLIRNQGEFSAQRDRDYDYLRKAEELAFVTNQRRKQAAQARAQNAAIRVDNLIYRGGAKTQPLPNYNGGRDFQRLVQAIAGKESGGNYGAVNPDSGAAGKYQIMPANFVGEGGWDRDALGKDISLQQYLNNPRLQERIARSKLREYFQKYGAEGAASAWYSGDPNKWKTSKGPQGKYPSVYNYVMDIIKRAGL